VAGTVAARARQHEKLVDLGRQPEMLQAENEDREQVADRPASFFGYPAGAEARVVAKPE
jgi:hypothetical protein